MIEGSTAMLAGRRIDVIEVECGMNPENHYHVPMETLKTRLEAAGYRLFGLYE